MLRIVFMGTPAFSVPSLSEIIAAGHEIAAVYTQPPRPAGRRGLETKKSPVQLFAEAAGIEVLSPKGLRRAPAHDVFAGHQCDVAVVVAYGLLLPAPVLNAPRLGCLNLHGSALPRWRGAAPIQRAIMAGDSKTAAMVMRMEKGLDTGPVCLAEQLAIDPDMTAGELHDRLSQLGAGLLVRALAALERGSLTCTAQPDNGVTYAAKIDKSEAKIDFARPAGEVHNQIRGMSPYPGAWFEVEIKGRKERVKVLRSELVASDGVAGDGATGGAPGQLLDDALTIACAVGAIRVIQVQRAGKRPMSAEDFLRGVPLAAQSRLGDPP